MNKEELCKAFCNEVSIKEVPAGLAVRTPFLRSDGDAIAFYVVKANTLAAHDACDLKKTKSGANHV